MGYWTIVVQGCGCHHNSKDGDGSEAPHDANRMAAKFVGNLTSAGHQIMAATFTHSGIDDLVPLAKQLNASAEIAEAGNSAPNKPLVKRCDEIKFFLEL
jgi:hypothetical protein